MKKQKRLVAMVLSLVLSAALCVPVSALDSGAEFSERIVAERLFEDISPASVETFYNDGRVTTVTKYVLDNGDVVTDTFERGANVARSYEGSDTAKRTVDDKYGSIELTASFRWWTSSGSPGGIGSWQSVKCTSASAVCTPAKYCSYSEKEVTHSDGEISWGKAWAKASAYFYPQDPGILIGNTYNIKITCTDTGDISDS